MAADDYAHRSELRDLRADMVDAQRHTESEVNKGFQSIRADMAEHAAMMERRYVTKDTYGPVEKLVYSLVGLVLVTVLGWIMALAYAHGGGK